MKKLELQELKSADYVQSVKTGEVLEVVGMEAGKYMLSNGKVYTESTIKRWYNLYEEQDTTANTEEQTNTSDLQDTNTQGNEIHEDTNSTVKTYVVEGNTATTGQQDLELDEDLENILIQLDCTAIKRKEYLGIYKDGYKGAVCMVRTTRKGNTHIDMKEKIYVALDEEVRQQIEVKYTTGIYDRTRGYFRISECDDLKVLAVVLRTALQLAS